jgi:hypothetical protein
MFHPRMEDSIIKKTLPNRIALKIAAKFTQPTKNINIKFYKAILYTLTSMFIWA